MKFIFFRNNNTTKKVLSTYLIACCCIFFVFLIISNESNISDASTIKQKNSSKKKLESLTLNPEKIHFAHPPFAKKTTVKVNSPVLCTPDEPGNIPESYASFENILFDFEGAQKGTLKIYYIENYKEIMRNIDLEIVNNTVELLQRLLVEKDKYKYKKHKDEYYLAGAIFPYLEISDAAQLFVSNVKVLEFKGKGKGIRYITAFAQDIIPVCNQSLYYIFQGLTSSQQYYISFVINISSKTGKYVYDCNYDSPSQQQFEKIMRKFEASGFTASSDNDKDFYNSSGYDLYTDKLIHELNAMPSSHFSSSLDVLDQFITSLEINE